jgi:hypothetical protein
MKAAIIQREQVVERVVRPRDRADVARPVPRRIRSPTLAQDGAGRDALLGGGWGGRVGADSRLPRLPHGGSLCPKGGALPHGQALRRAPSRLVAAVAARDPSLRGGDDVRRDLRDRAPERRGARGEATAQRRPFALRLAFRASPNTKTSERLLLSKDRGSRAQVRWRHCHRWHCRHYGWYRHHHHYRYW